MADDSKLHIFTAAPAVEAVSGDEEFTAHEILPDTDAGGRVIFREDVEPEAVRAALGKQLELLDQALGKIGAELRQWKIETVKVSVALEIKSGELTAGLVGGAGVKGAFEIELKRRDGGGSA